MQKKDLEEMEVRLKDTQDDMYREKLEADQKLSDKTKEFEEKNKELVDHYTVRPVHTYI